MKETNKAIEVFHGFVQERINLQARVNEKHDEEEQQQDSGEQSQLQQGNDIERQFSKNDDDFEFVEGVEDYQVDIPVQPPSYSNFISSYLPFLSIKRRGSTPPTPNDHTAELSSSTTPSSSTAAHLTTSKEERSSHFTGHSKVIYLSGLDSSSTPTKCSATTTQPLDTTIRPWQWSCPIPRLRILIMVVGTRSVYSSSSLLID